MNLYYISGLAADEKMFSRIDFGNRVKPHFLPWHLPQSTSESLADYIQKFAAQIDTAEPFALMGLSFGGMVCCQLNETIKPQKTIIISSVSNYKQFPPWFHWIRKTGIYKLSKAKHIKKRPAAINNFLFGAETDTAKKLVLDALQSADEFLLDWSIRTILHWRFNKPVPNLVHIHGAADKIFPLRYVQPHHIIKDGGHLTVFNEGVPVSAIVKQELSLM